MLTDAEREELAALRREDELNGLGDRPHGMGVEKIRRLLELQQKVESSPASVTFDHREFAFLQRILNVKHFPDSAYDHWRALMTEYGIPPAQQHAFLAKLGILQ